MRIVFATLHAARGPARTFRRVVVAGAALVAVLLSLACNRDPVAGQWFACTASEQCGEGWSCAACPARGPSAGLCVPDGGGVPAECGSSGEDVRADGDPGEGARDAGGENAEVAQDTGGGDEGPIEDAPPVAGQFGHPCTANGDCAAGYCVDGPDGRVCTKPCVAESDCPAPWACGTIPGTYPDVVFVCLALFPRICDPCERNADCQANSPGTPAGAACVDRGDRGRFCGGDCSSPGCPAAYECRQDARDVDGNVSPQCVPVSDVECPCSAAAIAAGLQTTCAITNAWGTCPGTRRCEAGGLGACDARTPAAEACNLKDDDCDGQTDEGPGKFPCQRTNGFGTCPGTGGCANGVVTNCDAPAAAAEVCNGLDDDCDGQTDEDLCYDGNECTEDQCKPGTQECLFVPRQGACDDGNPCTVNDHCDKASGTCVGGSKRNCDDQNPCTDDACDAGTGSCIHLNNVASCDDGNLCTENDACVNGACQPGTPKDCSTDNPCRTNLHCDSKTGLCAWTGNDGVPCDDGDPCTTGDVCSAGSCIGPKGYCEGHVCTPTPPQTVCYAACVTTMNFPTCVCQCM